MNMARAVKTNDKHLHFCYKLTSRLTFIALASILQGHTLALFLGSRDKRWGCCFPRAHSLVGRRADYNRIVITARTGHSQNSGKGHLPDWGPGRKISKGGDAI